MAFKLEWSEEALEDIESIAIYIEKDSLTYVKDDYIARYKRYEWIEKRLKTTLDTLYYHRQSLQLQINFLR